MISHSEAAPARRESLFEINAEIAALQQQREFADEEGDSVRVAEIDVEIKLYLQEWLPKKVDGIRGFIRAQENAEMVHGAEAELHAALAKQARSNIDRVKKMCIEVMQYFGVSLFKGALHTIKRVGNGGMKQLDIRQPELVPLYLQRATVVMSVPLLRRICKELTEVDCREMYKTTTEPDMAAIRAALEAGEAVPGCVLLARGEHVRVS